MGKTLKGLIAGLGTFCMLVNSMTTLGASAEIGTYNLGDLNMDGEVNSADMLLMKRQCLGMVEVTENREILGDLDGNGCNSADFLRFKKIMLGLDEAPKGTVEVDPMIVKGSRSLTNGTLEWNADFNDDNDVINCTYSGESLLARAQLSKGSVPCNTTITDSDGNTIDFAEKNDEMSELAVFNSNTEDGLRFTHNRLDFWTEEGYRMGFNFGPTVALETDERCLGDLVNCGTYVNNDEKVAITKSVVQNDTSIHNLNFKQSIKDKQTVLTYSTSKDFNLVHNVNSQNDCSFRFSDYSVSLKRDDDGTLRGGVASNFMIKEGDQMVTALPLKEFDVQQGSISSLELCNGFYLVIDDVDPSQLLVKIYKPNYLSEVAVTSKSLATLVTAGFIYKSEDNVFDVASYSIVDCETLRVGCGSVTNQTTDNTKILYNPDRIDFIDGYKVAIDYEYKVFETYEREFDKPKTTVIHTLEGHKAEFSTDYYGGTKYYYGTISKGSGEEASFSYIPYSQLIAKTPKYSGTMSFVNGTTIDVAVRDSNSYCFKFPENTGKIDATVVDSEKEPILNYCFDYDALK